MQTKILSGIAVILTVLIASIVVSRSAMRVATIQDTLGLVPANIPGLVVDTSGSTLILRWQDPKTHKLYDDDAVNELMRQKK